MLTFRSEIENPVVQKDILDLEKKIKLYREGKIDDEKFRSLRLVRGIYGQRQPGVQMIRIKLPFGRITPKQLIKIADISDEFAGSNLHATTRQDIQIHFVSLDRTPELWAKLEEDQITIREACGNTVRNITASDTAGIDPKEPFDVSPYAYETFRYFLRNPICQEMGRKFKIAFSSSEEDTAFSFIHDLGFIPKIKQIDGREVKGFKVLIAGGLGAQPFHAGVAYEFLPEDQIIPFSEAVLRVFDRHGERTRRMKARFKYLFEDIGLEGLMNLVNEEWKAIKVKSYQIDAGVLLEILPPPVREYPAVSVSDPQKFEKWQRANVFEQKQKGYYGVYIKLLLGNLDSARARKLAAIVPQFASDDIRITINQGYLLKFITKEALPGLFNALNEIGLAEPGFNSTADVTACPGTDSCNLAISSSTGISQALEQVIVNEFPDLIFNNDIKIKISGCPNSCGQHGIASIGFHGSSLKHQGKVLPALQVVLGGGIVGDGIGALAEKVIKIPSKRGPQAVRILLNDYLENSLEGEYYFNYYKRLGEKYFYDLLKPLTDLSTVIPEDFIDWGKESFFAVETAVGECAGVMIDLVATLLYESEEKLGWARETLESKQFADSIYHSYSSFVNGAKSLLIDKGVKTNTQTGIINDFEKHFAETGLFSFPGGFREYVLRINKYEPTEHFAMQYLKDALTFQKDLYEFRKKEEAVTNQ